jgi:hypothetical protein
MKIEMKPVPVVESKAYLHCPICTHTVEGTVLTRGRTTKVKSGQKCSRCSASLDPAYILHYDKAA